jgi:hypothetical protein
MTTNYFKHRYFLYIIKWFDKEKEKDIYNIEKMNKKMRLHKKKEQKWEILEKMNLLLCVGVLDVDVWGCINYYKRRGLI